MSMKAKSNAERQEALRKANAKRQAAIRARREAQGLKEVRNIYATPEDAKLIKKYAKSLGDRHETSNCTK